jgi:hypothetical protein
MEHIFIVASVALNGIFVGASLDQSMKQLPARRRIGVVVYSAYSRAADEGRSLAWYLILGVGAGVTTVAAATTAWFEDPSAPWTTLLVMAALSVIQTFATVTPMNFSRRHNVEEAELHQLFERFARWQNLRSIVQLLGVVGIPWFACLQAWLSFFVISKLRASGVRFPVR